MLHYDAGPTAAADHVLEALSIVVRGVGLTLVVSKSAAQTGTWRPRRRPNWVFSMPTTAWLASTPIGTDQFVHAFLSSKQQQVRDEIQPLEDLPHPLTWQDKWVILSCSLHLRQFACSAPLSPQLRGRLPARISNDTL
jgi:hypothetical protein